MKIRAIIVDDEILSIESLNTIICKYCPNVEVIGAATSADDGIKEIENKNPDLVFIDIEMPHKNGFQLLEKFPNRNFFVIFITAFNQYAINAFKVNAIDYILKPVDYTELCLAVRKIEDYKSKIVKTLPQYDKLMDNINMILPDKVALPGIDGIQFISKQDIIYAEADGSYSIIFIKDQKKIVISKNLSHLESLLNSKIFYRCHKSNLVNLAHVFKFNFKDGGTLEMCDGSIVMISQNKKNEFIEKMTGLSS